MIMIVHSFCKANMDVKDILSAKISAENIAENFMETIEIKKYSPFDRLYFFRIHLHDTKINHYANLYG